MMRAVLIMLLMSSASYAQAVAPLPEPEPAPSFHTPAFTPAGAGASHGALAAPERELAPRSPNRRTLPVTNEPGIWAADGALVDADGPSLLGFAPPVAPDLFTLPGLTKMRRCSKDLNDLIDRAKQRERAMALPSDARECLAAQLFRVCALQYEAEAKEALAASPHAETHFRQYQSMAEMGGAWIDRACRGPSSPKEANRVFSIVINEWLKHNSETR